MVDAERLNEIVKAGRDDVFSLSLNTDPSLAEHQRPNPAYRVWTHNAVRRLLRRLSPEARERAEPVARRMLAHVDAMPQEGRGLALFAGPRLWEIYTLPFPLPNHLAYGAPDAVPVLWAIHEYAPYAIVLVFHDHARLLVAYLGWTAVVDEITLDLDTEQWRFKYGRLATSSRRVGTGVGRGIQSDAHEARVLAQYRRFWRHVAETAAHRLTAQSIDRIIIAGNKEAAVAVSALLPRSLHEAVIGTVAVPPNATLAQIQARVLPVALAHRHARDRRLVRSIAQERRPKGIGVEGATATLEALAAGNLRVVVADRDMQATTWTCSRCGALGMKPAPCAACGGEMRRLMLPWELPSLVRRYGAVLELVGAEAARPLADGVGGLLRYPPATSVNMCRGA
ncbi:MAG TPA: VLRF1 family aeRF1-type release factor [bacterium]|nr:VLRF1 family aeRF1-type release factor [bacterium]